MIQNGYGKAIYNLEESLNNISTDLKKSLYITTPKTFSSYAARIYCESEIAKESLSKLTDRNSELETVNLFLSQVGNYTLSLSKDLISGRNLTENQKDNLYLLSNTADTVSKAISDTEITLNNAEYWGKEIENKIKNSVDKRELASSLTELEEKLTDYPTLIYDGPYSDHILSKQPTMIKNKPEVSKNQALNLAYKVLGNNQNLIYTDSQEGKIECFLFQNENVNIAISKYGGYPVYMLKNRKIGNKNLSCEDMVDKASKFLKEQGFDNMEITYYELRDGLLTCNFAFLDGKTLCYTDLIKVGVASDNGEIMSLETVGFLTNHTVRVFSAPMHTEEEAIETLSGNLSADKPKIVLIPTAGGGELRCYEFNCSDNENNILIYVNISNLECEDVLIVIKSENGTLVK